MWLSVAFQPFQSSHGINNFSCLFWQQDIKINQAYMFMEGIMHINNAGNK